jgi:hypothetical protein
LSMIVVVSLVASPIVWLHYFVLLVVPIALTRKTLSWPWFLPLALVLCPGYGNGDQAETALALLVLGLVAASTLVSTSGAPLAASPPR